ncbi:hypothetical protein VNO80_18761 [Phaseolus coccineus]|uniref:Uncharacterized protein n=1 Tax=Phaseolus coccineus TaxID=3886 RepID=A0AAN9QZQ2_PHACN
MDAATQGIEFSVTDLRAATEVLLLLFRLNYSSQSQYLQPAQSALLLPSILLTLNPEISFPFKGTTRSRRRSFKESLGHPVTSSHISPPQLNTIRITILSIIPFLFLSTPMMSKVLLFSLFLSLPTISSSFRF